MLKTVPVNTEKREEFIDITERIEDMISAAGVKDGICYIYCPHTTAALTINENADVDVVADILSQLSELVPGKKSYRHSEGNSDAHIKSSLLGNCLTVIIRDSKPLLGTWQGIFFCEFDGPRERRVHIKTIKA